MMQCIVSRLLYLHHILHFATDRTEAPVVTWYYGIGATYYSVNPSTGFYDKKYAVDKYEMTTVSKDWGTTVELLATATDF